MQKDRSFWSDWSIFLRRWGLDEVAAALLDGAGPVSMILAQFLYAGQPVLHQLIPSERLQALTSLIEDQEESHSFAAYLREEIIG